MPAQTKSTVDLAAYCHEVAERAKVASAQLTSVSGQQKIDWLRQSANLLRTSAEVINAANQKDLAAAPDYGLTDAQVDRLRLTPDRIESIAVGLEEVAALREPVGRVLDSTVRPNGLRIDKVCVPLGVVFFIYESRPNVTADAAAICVKAGNAVILRGGKEALHSSRAIVDLLAEAAEAAGLPRDAVQLVSTTDRAAVGHFLKQSDFIDVAIPRGGEGLIRRVVAEATMPVIKHFDGNCHVYVDAAADLDAAEAIVVNSKCHRLGVCNAAESLVVHADIAAEAVPRLVIALNKQEIEVRGCPKVCELAPSAVPATEEDFGAEFLGPTISAVVVGSLDEAIRHINRYSSGHTESIVTTNLAASREFAERIDSAAVVINASTRFNDGGEFGLGAEIGISTDKFHARGPCGVDELTSYKYIVHGQGHTRK
ncbi:Gamma-glutamyl phosphate reductase [Posidoniimonas polymericola]|uniref:Gamma-glutamyl phosphate reductase n=1 Tax=Posidoniimonas polymericola TaxID=2528002 RepID=A0A5C5YI70_9BACT|nr:glutamate-5-semialdehyde dehydrogenase [Posidoniimonas polymericola]TWT74542.1 Gamma-glutamyl phosphate reductase [Posidoniimonas polymericola]